MNFDLQIATFILTFFNLIVIPLGWFLYRHIKIWREEEIARQKQEAEDKERQKNAWLAMLRDRLFQSGTFFIELGAVPADVKANLLDMGEAYLHMGGNGNGHVIYEKIKALPVNDNILKEYQKQKIRELASDVERILRETEAFERSKNNDNNG